MYGRCLQLQLQNVYLSLIFPSYTVVELISKKLVTKNVKGLGNNVRIFPLYDV